MGDRHFATPEQPGASAGQLWPIWAAVAIVFVGIGWKALMVPSSRGGLNQVQDERRLIDEYLSRIERSRGNKFTAAQRSRIYDFAQSDLMKKAVSGIPDKQPEEQEKRLEGMVRMALVRSGDTLPVPREITAAVLSGTSDDELPQMLYDFICTRFSRTGAYQGGNESFLRALRKLPRGLRIVFTMYSLDGEISNGGVGQLFTNSSGTYLTEMLEDCRLIGAEKHAAALNAAMKKWRPRDRFEAAEREMNEWDRKYYALEESEPLNALITKYIHSHSDETVTSR